MNLKHRFVAMAGALTLSGVAALAQTDRSAEPPNPTFVGGYPTAETSRRLKDELLFQNAVQTYLWALPALNIYSMKEGSEKVFGKGYNVLPVWKERVNAKTLVTTPNSDVIYAMGYLDLAEDGPIVIEAPPGLQGILDDFWQRPICSEGEIDGRVWCGDVGLPGPDRGKGGKYLLLPPDYKGATPDGYYTMRSRTYEVFVFWRGFFKDPKDLAPPVENIERTLTYPLGKKDSAKPMQFPDASNVPANMLFPTDGAAFDMLARFINHEYVDPGDMWMRGVAATLGIVKGKAFAPHAALRATLDRAAHTAFGLSRSVAFEPGSAFPQVYQDRKWTNAIPCACPWFATPTFDQTDPRAAFFSIAYSMSPAMSVNMVDVGAKYPIAFTDADGNLLSGAKPYRLRLPSDIPAKLFWSVTVYDALTGSGLDNGQPFPSINTMDGPATNSDGSTDIFGPAAPGEGKNWLRTVPDKGYFVILRLYGPTEPYFNQTWRPSDLEEVK